MAKTSAISELQQEIEDVRHEAFAAGYAAAMKAVRELASKPAPAAAAAPVRRRGRGGTARKSAAGEPSRGRRARARGEASRPRRAAAGRGGNSQVIDQILEAASPRALRQAEIRKALQEKGREVSFTSIRHTLSQLEARNRAEQIGDNKAWRHRGAPGS